MTTKFTYTKEVNLEQLEKEINASSIRWGVSEIYSEDVNVVINFKGDLSDAEINTLNTLVETHIPIIEHDADIVKLGSTTDDFGTPMVYSTSKPLGYYVCFQGSGDTETEIGGGEKIVFRLTSKDEFVSKDFTFNEDVYLKDGYMIVKNAAFGASLDIDIIHPVYGITVLSFGKKIPIFGTGWFPLDTEDRAFLPKGMIIRITVYNSKGTDNNKDEEFPTNFYVAGRFELYRKKPPGA